MPSVGTDPHLAYARLKPNGLRIDAGYREGDAVSPNYDAMLAKVIAWAPTRDAAINRLNRGLEETDIRGIVTNTPFLSALVTHPDVRANAIDTGFIERELTVLTPDWRRLAISNYARPSPPSSRTKQQAARAAGTSPWQTAGWMPVGRRQRVFKFKHGSDEQRVTLNYGSGPATISIGTRELGFETAAADDGHFDLTLDGARSHIVSVIEGHELYLRTRHGRFDMHWVDPFGGDDEEQVGEDKIVCAVARHRGGAAGRGGRDP